MNKSDLVDELAKETRLTKIDLEATLNALFHLIQTRVAEGDDVTLSGFGTFTLLTRKARRGYNPHTGSELQVPEIVLPKFRAGKDFRKAVNKK